jgi:hypothetical protein
MRNTEHGDYAPALLIVATELKLDSRGTQIGSHSPNGIAQGVEAFRQRTERQSAWLTIESGRARSSATVPVKPTRANTASGW